MMIAQRRPMRWGRAPDRNDHGGGQLLHFAPCQESARADSRNGSGLASDERGSPCSTPCASATWLTSFGSSKDGRMVRNSTIGWRRSGGSVRIIKLWENSRGISGTWTGRRKRRRAEAPGGFRQRSRHGPYSIASRTYVREQLLGQSYSRGPFDPSPAACCAQASGGNKLARVSGSARKVEGSAS